MKKASFNHGAVHEFLITFAAAGGNEATLTELTKDIGRCRQVLKLLGGTYELRPKALAINLTADPYCPDDMRVVEHTQAVSGEWEFDASQIVRHLDDEQEPGKRIEGNELRKRLTTQPVLNANVLDWLLQDEAKHLIPEEWKHCLVFFWGTIYYYGDEQDGMLLVRCLRWDRDNRDWTWGKRWLEDEWHSAHCAALLAPK